MSTANIKPADIPDGGPAFPVVFEHQEATSERPGMSLRHYFAGQALAGLMVNYDSHKLSIPACVELARDAADALLTALEAKK